MPREYLPRENELRALVQEHVARGKVDIAVGSGGSNGSQLAVEANLALAGPTSTVGGGCRKL